MLRDVLGHFLMEEVATVMMGGAMYLCRHRMHRAIRIAIVIAADLGLAYLCVRILG